MTLFTIRSTETGFGAHAGPMISGGQRVIFDPAGTFQLEAAPRRNDLHYGIIPTILEVYINYHARETFDVEMREVQVTRAEAGALIYAAQACGAVPKAQCAISISRILRTQSCFQNLPASYFPSRLAKAFEDLPGATVEVFSDQDADDKDSVLLHAPKRRELAN